MSGLVLGVAVKDARSSQHASSSSASSETRSLRLLVRPSPSSTTENPWFTYAWQEGTTEPPLEVGRVASPPLIVTRGKPVEITVVNKLSEPTAVHWHGIELDSYFDGVPGFSGTAKRLAPLTAPGDSFVVRFTPPRAGTFIYHTHHDENRQQAAGLAAPIIVLEPGEKFDAAHDHAIVLSSPGDQTEATRVVWMNAQEQPAPITLRVGESIRLRVVNMTLRRAGIRIRLLQGESPLPLRMIAKDGAPTVPGIAAERPTAQQIAIGETMDFLVTAATSGDLRMQFRVGAAADGRVLGTYQIRVVP